MNWLKRLWHRLWHRLFPCRYVGLDIAADGSECEVCCTYDPKSQTRTIVSARHK